MKSILLSFCIVLSSFAGTKSIHMNGTWSTTKRVLEKRIPIEVSINENIKELSIEFTANIGIVYVTISDLNGNSIYNCTANTINDKTTNIILNNTLKGEFILFVTDKENEAFGEFTLTN